VLNLHGIVRGAVQAVNRDRTVAYLESLGYVPNASGRQVPAYGPPLVKWAQIQPPSGRDLRHMEFLNIQGTTRVVYLYSDPLAIVRVNAQGGDLLQFPQFSGAPFDNWLITHVEETWDVGPPATPGILYDSEGRVVLNSQGMPVLTSSGPSPYAGWSRVFATLQTDRSIVPDYVTDSLGNLVWDSQGQAVFGSSPGIVIDSQGRNVLNSVGQPVTSS